MDRKRLELHPHRVLPRAMTHRAATVAGVLEPAYPLRTERLDLRPFQEGDVDFLAELQGDPDITRYLYYEPLTPEESAKVLAKRLQNRVLRGDGDLLSLVAVLRETGDRVGEATLFYRSVEHAGGEVGYLVHPAHQRRGYATEMSAEMLRLAFEDLHLHRVVGRLDGRNTASASVLEKLGMRREAHLISNEFVKGEWCDELDYALLADEWAAIRSSSA
jgi:RimJ/RimL family protein N-acetyltransferase